MNNKHLSWYKEINNNFIIASRAYFLQKGDTIPLCCHHKLRHENHSVGYLCTYRVQIELICYKVFLVNTFIPIGSVVWHDQSQQFSYRVKRLLKYILVSWWDFWIYISLMCRVFGCIVHKEYFLFHQIDSRRILYIELQNFQCENLYQIYRTHTNLFVSWVLIQYTVIYSIW